MYKNLVDFDRLESQLPMLHSVVETIFNLASNNSSVTITSVRMLLNMLNNSIFGRSMCDQVYTLGLIYVTVPMTSATAERSFSTLRRIRTYLRQTMTQQRLNDCMLLHIHKELTDKVVIDEVAKAFVVANDERIRYFGKKL